jgi:hypothetical protein
MQPIQIKQGTTYQQDHPIQGQGPTTIQRQKHPNQGLPTTCQNNPI